MWKSLGLLFSILFITQTVMAGGAAIRRSEDNLVGMEIDNRNAGTSATAGVSMSSPSATMTIKMTGPGASYPPGPNLGVIEATDLYLDATVLLPNLKNCNVLGTNGAGEIVCKSYAPVGGYILLSNGDNVLLSSGDKLLVSY